MPSLVERTAKPIFIVGSGRSGSTILTWCLGQHPNIIPQEESDWLGPFAIDAAVGYERGTVRENGDSSAQTSFNMTNFSGASVKLSTG